MELTPRELWVSQIMADQLQKQRNAKNGNLKGHRSHNNERRREDLCIMNNNAVLNLKHIIIIITIIVIIILILIILQMEMALREL